MRKLSKILAAFSFVAGIGLLVACGGGGGSTPSAPSAPGNPVAPTVAPTATPVGATPSPTPVGATPSPTPTATPKGATPSPTPTPTPPPATPTPSTTTLQVGDGQTNGNVNPLLVINTAPDSRGYMHGGNLEPGDQGATSSGGGQGPVNNGVVDGVPCAASMSNDYHVHFFLGVFYNGQELGIPAGVGMVNPDPPSDNINGVLNQSYYADCYYDMHAHDNSGMIHVETAYNTPQNCGAASGNPPTQLCNYASPFTLQTFFDIWGISFSANSFGPLSGPVQIYTSTPANYNSYSACGTTSVNTVVTPCVTQSSTYQAFLGLPAQIPIYSHTTIWILVGTGNPYGQGLPNVNWQEGNP
ncbi:MAG TPA: hypothetical protein VGG22_15740 [Candidatus Baltobacteraceae bacterium]|jgi:hypothetical protein